VQQESSVRELARTAEPVQLYRAQGRYGLAEKFMNDFEVLRKALEEVEGADE
jgi:hypothetical protein